VRRRRARHLILFLALTTGFVQASAAFDLGLQFLAEATLAGDLEVDDTLVGGLSGLTYDPGCDLYYAISDDRGHFAASRFYTLRVQADGDNVAVDVIASTTLRDLDGTVFDRGDLDPEALAFHHDGSLFVGSEGIPHRGIPPLVGRFTLDGRMLGAVPLPEHYLAIDGGSRGVRDNLGFEGVGLSPGGDLLFVAAENALLQDGPAADLQTGSPTRLLVIDLATGRAVGEYLYHVEPVPDQPRPATAFNTNGISEILALDGWRLLVVERSFSVGVGNRIRIYLVDLEGAENYLGAENLREVGGRPPVPLAKVLVADLGELGIKPDNIEGMTLGPALADGRRMLVMIADNNFQPSVQANQILFFAVSGVAPPVIDRPEVGIEDIQGAGHYSPLVGRCVSGVTGVVTAILGGGKGQAIFIQSPEGDGDPGTSDGLLVRTLEGVATVAVGDLVRLDGRVEERVWRAELPVTRLVASELDVMDRNRNLPPPVILGGGGRRIPRPEIAAPGLVAFDPARFAADAFETLEGMRVRVEEAAVVGPTSHYGEIVVLADGGRGSSQRTTRGGVRLGTGNPNPERIMINDGLVPDPPGLVVGDSLGGAVDGILHYSYGNYKLLNTSVLPPVNVGGLDREKTALKGEADHLTVATFNVENLSYTSSEEKFRRVAGIVATHLGSPDIVALQEVQDDTGPEDDGTVTAERTLARLIDSIETAGGARYDTRWVDPVDNADGGQPGANIRTAYLFNPERVGFVDRGGDLDQTETEVLAGSRLSRNPGLVDPDNAAFNAGADGHGGSRKPLVGEFVFAERRLVLVNLHFVSKGGDDPIFGRRQPPVTHSTQRRLEQARVVAEFVTSLMADDPSARIVVLGDLNDFEDSVPLQALEEAGFEDLIKRLPGNEGYSYVYQGNSQVLDHVLTSEAAAEGAIIDAVHVNAEFPSTDRASDHDPIIVKLAF
jgi:endonuclease/exonuclease/phosphatase family metal-dependent hydrolase